MGQGETQVNKNMRKIRGQARLTNLTMENPGIETWLDQEYINQDIDDELRKLGNRKAHGGRWNTGRSTQGEKKMGDRTDNKDDERGK